MRRMRFAIAIPQFYGDGEFDPAAFRAYLARVEELGFDSAWAQEHVLGQSPMLGPIETMTYAAACTEQLRLGCAVFVSTLYGPVHLAKSLSTLDQLSRGRVEVGVGTGGGTGRSPPSAWIPSRYVARFTEGLAPDEGAVDRASRHLRRGVLAAQGRGDGAQAVPEAAPADLVRRIQPAALRRAVRLGDGFFGAGSTITGQFADQVQVVREALAGPAWPASFRIAKRVYIAMDAGSGRARDRINHALERLYGRRSPDIEAAAVTGPPAECARELRQVAEAGAELILFTPLFELAEHAERLAAEVIPQLG